MRFARLALAPALFLAACVTPAEQASAPLSCKAGDQMVETQLFFGQTKPNGATLSARSWQGFVDREIVPRFPEGFTVLDGAGFWRNRATQRTISEKSKVVVRLHPPSAEADAAIGAVVDAYKTQFEQESVLRTDRATCAQF